MYKLTKDIKQLSTLLILIGISAISYGFFHSFSVISDDEIKSAVKDIAKELKLEYKADYKQENKIYLDDNDQLIENKDESNYAESNTKDHDVDYSELIYKVEKKLNCHIDKSHIHSVGDVIYAAKHYFHAKHQRPWSSLLICTLFFLMISVAATLWWALQYVAQAGWSALLLRIPMAISSFIPYAATILIFIIITAGLHWHHTFHWMAEGIMDPTDPYYDEIIANKSSYLNIPFFN